MMIFQTKHTLIPNFKSPKLEILPNQNSCHLNLKGDTLIRIMWNEEKTNFRILITDDFDYRLPSDVIPLGYDLELQPDIYNNGSHFFNGSVSIDVECLNDTSIITLNIYKDLEVEGL